MLQLNLRRIEKEINLDDLLRKIEDILMFEVGSIRMERNGIHISGPWGKFMPMGALGDGYQATIAWLMDMYGWKMLFEKRLVDAEIRGIVFLDEIEQHLHPVWQTGIVGRLNQQFKHVQFIITTHSPLVAVNSCSSSLSNLHSKLFVLDWNGDHVDISEINEPLNDLDYNQLLASEAFGHIYNTNTEVDQILHDMSQLVSIDAPSKKQIAKLEKIKRELKNIIFPEGRTLIERIVERDYYKELEKNTKLLRDILKSD